jgi:hypothetical protein
MANINITYGDNYNFYYSQATRSVICTTYYKGKIVKGVAKCDPNDTFDLETGRQLAYLRCRKKFFKRKFERAADTYARAVVEANRAEDRRQRAVEFINDATRELNEVKQALATLETELEN